MYWRIIRINGDGSIRVIYDGTSAHDNSDTTKDRIIGSSAFNETADDNAYVGYMYGATEASTYEATHANINDSTIKTYLDTWYQTNILGTKNEQYLTDNIFCNDRSISSRILSDFTNKGYGTESTSYRWANGPWTTGGYNSRIKLICPQKNDAFTVNATMYGNGDLTYPIGLITTDEVVLAGGWNTYNSGYYLYSEGSYWTLSPSYFNGSCTNKSIVHIGDAVNYLVCSNDSGDVRPVLNLSQEVLKNGDGTMENPYEP